MLALSAMNIENRLFNVSCQPFMQLKSINHVPLKLLYAHHSKFLLEGKIFQTFFSREGFCVLSQTVFDPPLS